MKYSNSHSKEPPRIEKVPPWRKFLFSNNQKVPLVRYFFRVKKYILAQKEPPNQKKNQPIRKVPYWNLLRVLKKVPTWRNFLFSNNQKVPLGWYFSKFKIHPSKKSTSLPPSLKKYLSVLKLPSLKFHHDASSRKFNIVICWGVRGYESLSSWVISQFYEVERISQSV